MKLPRNRGCFGTAGYTMAEIVVVITVMGVLASIIVPVYGGLRRSSLQTAAVHHAKLVNAARDCFALTIPSAYQQWSAAPDDATRLGLLISEHLLSGEAGQYLAMPGDYSLELSGGLRAKTVLKQKGDAIGY